MISKRSEEMVVAVCLVGAVVMVALAPSVCGQVTVDWPVMNATPQQTRFADIAAGSPPQGILWRYPSTVQYPVLSNGMVFLQSAVLESETGRCLYKFADAAGAQAIGRIWIQQDYDPHLYLFRARRGPRTDSTYPVTVEAYDFTQIPTDGAASWPQIWEGTYELTTWRPWMTKPVLAVYGFSDAEAQQSDALYLSAEDGAGIVKICAKDGSQLWRVEAESHGSVAIGEVDHSNEALVVAAGWLRGGAPTGKVTAMYEGNGEIRWQKAYDGGQPTLLPGPFNKVVFPAWGEPTKKKGRSSSANLIVCLDTDAGTELWRRQIGSSSWPWNGPVAVRYHDDGNGNATATIYATIGSGSPYDTDHPLYAFTLDGQDAWVPNPLYLPSGTISVPTATQDIVYMDLLDGSLYSVDAVTGNECGLAQFELAAGEFDLPIVVSNDGSYFLYDRSDRLGYMALSPEQTHNMAVMDISVPSQIPDQATSFDIVVENVGNFEENVDVVLFIDGSEVCRWTSAYTPYGTQGSAQAFTYQWAAPGAGNHTVTATVTEVTGEVGIYDNTLSKQVSVLGTDVVTITSAYWVEKNKRLRVTATSSAAGEASLELYYPDLNDPEPSPMTYDPATGKYDYSGRQPDYYDTVWVTSSGGGEDVAAVAYRAK
jgi:hypothetical protein